MGTLIKFCNGAFYPTSRIREIAPRFVYHEQSVLFEPQTSTDQFTIQTYRHVSIKYDLLFMDSPEISTLVDGYVDLETKESALEYSELWDRLSDKTKNAFLGRMQKIRKHLRTKERQRPVGVAEDGQVAHVASINHRVVVDERREQFFRERIRWCSEHIATRNIEEKMSSYDALLRYFDSRQDMKRADTTNVASEEEIKSIASKIEDLSKILVVLIV